MALTRGSRRALAAAALVAVGTPALLLLPPFLVGPEVLPPASVTAARPLAPPPLPPLAALYRRSLFGGAGEPKAPADAPVLLGIAGRIDADAIAMVRSGDGSTRSLRPGDSVDGWRLESLAADAASFVRGTETVRIPVAGAEEAPAAEAQPVDEQPPG